MKFKRKSLEFVQEALELMRDHYSQDPSKRKKELEKVSKLLSEVEEALAEKREKRGKA